MSENTHKQSQGFGLVEVLIAMLVIAAGVLALARFQSTVISESRVNKERSEALGVCTEFLSQPRAWTGTNQVTANEGISIPEPGGDPIEFAAISGTVNSYTPTLSLAANNTLTATCSWGDGEVSVSTVFEPHNLVAGALFSSPDEGGNDSIFATSPTLNANSSEEISDRVLLVADNGLSVGEIIESGTSPSSEIFAKPSDVTADQTYIVDKTGTTASRAYLCDSEVPEGIPSSLDSNFIPPVDGDSVPESVKALRVYIKGDAPLETDALPLRGIKLYETVNVQKTPASVGYEEYCIPRVVYNGGVIVAITGDIYSAIDNKGSDEPYLPVSLFTFNTSESGTYCYFNPKPEDTTAPYACYVGGNCAFGEKSSVDFEWEENFFVCPPYNLEEAKSAVGDGGWRGRVGVLEIAEEGYNVCFYEDVWGGSDTYTEFRNTARDYYTRNRLDNTYDINEGINKSYECQNFMIIDGTNDLQKHCGIAAKSVPNLTLAGRSIVRYLDEYPSSGTNIFDPTVDSSACTIPNIIQIIGSISQSKEAEAASAVPQVTATYDSQDPVYCIVSVDSYLCEVAYNERDGADGTGDLIPPNGEIDIVATFGDTDSPVCSSYDVPTGNATHDYDGCTLDLSDWSTPTADEELFTFTGTVTGPNADTEGYSDGIRYLRAIYQGVHYGCSFVTDIADQNDTFSCTIAVPVGIKSVNNVVLEAEDNTSYDVDLAETDGQQSELAIAGITSGEIISEAISVTRNDTYALTGTITWSANADPYRNQKVSINPGNPDLSCTVNDPTKIISDTDGSTLGYIAGYECTIISGTDVTFSVNKGCKDYTFRSDTQTSNNATLTLGYDTVSYNIANEDIEICAAKSGP